MGSLCGIESTSAAAVRQCDADDILLAIINVLLHDMVMLREVKGVAARESGVAEKLFSGDCRSHQATNDYEETAMADEGNMKRPLRAFVRVKQRRGSD